MNNNPANIATLDLLCNLADRQWTLRVGALMDVEVDHCHNRNEQQEIYYVGLIT